jgi:hypothetical protein
VDLLTYGRPQRRAIRGVESIPATREPVHAKRHPDQGAWFICEMVLFRVQLHSLDLVSSQQPIAKSAHLSPVHRFCQKQPQVTAAAATLQIGGNLLASQRAGQVAQALPGLGVVRIEDGETGSAFLVKKICAESDLTPQVGKQVAHVQWFVHTNIASIIKLAGVQVPPLDESLGQHQRWTREFCVRNWQALRR